MLSPEIAHTSSARPYIRIEFALHPTPFRLPGTLLLEVSSLPLIASGVLATSTKINLVTRSTAVILPLRTVSTKHVSHV